MQSIILQINYHLNYFNYIKTKESSRGFGVLGLIIMLNSNLRRFLVAVCIDDMNFINKWLNFTQIHPLTRRMILNKLQYPKAKPYEAWQSRNPHNPNTPKP